VSPLITMTELQETNLFFTAVQPQSDLITRVSPGIESEYHAPLVKWVGRCVFDIERFATHTELSGADARQRATTTLTVRPSERLIVAADADFARTHTPGELTALTGLTFARARAERATVHSSVTRQLDPVTAAAVDYRFSDDSLAGGIGIRTHTGALGLTHRLSLRDTIRA